MSASTADTLLSLRGVHKRFPGVHALKGVSLDVRRGEVHAVVGENGAGKSTLMQILAGVYRPDDGVLTFDGTTGSFATEREAQAAGVAIVFQERSLFGPLSVAENVFAGRQPGTLGGIDFAKLYTDTARLLERVGLRVDPSAAVETLSPGEQQLVEIAKALSLNAKLLILDEPTATLTPAETATLFGVARGLKAQGVAVVYISHRLEEVFELADRVTVLKDGEGQGTFAVADVTPQLLVRRMVGRDVEFDRPTDRAPESRAVLEVNGLTDTGSTGRVRLADVSFTVRAGEILGLGGLVGAGRTETALGVFGGRPGCVGEVRVNGKPVRIRSPQDAIAAGIGYVPEDRKDAGLFLDMGLAANVVVATLRGVVLNDAAQERTGNGYREKLRIASRGGDEPVRALSGGNQQKVLLARWLEVNPAVLIVDEPTRGVDVGAKREVHAVLFDLARKGTALVVISSDLPELLALADRVVVLRGGRVTGELSRDELTEEAVIALSSGVSR
ncbi:MAG: sugar ABC transporter ATP-binding protein [Gemmataceae bacterium]